MTYPALKEVLDKRMLLEDEKKMWLRLGFYVANEERKIYNSNRSGYTSVIAIIDGMGNVLDMEAIMARNIRQSILDWWQVERIAPRAKEPKEVIDTTGLAELENRNG